MMSHRLTHSAIRHHPMPRHVSNQTVMATGMIAERETMQADNRWAQPVVSDLATVPIETNHSKRDCEQQLSVHSPPLSILPPQVTPSSANIPNILFPPQRVEPIEMARSHQQMPSNRQKTGYVQSATTDEHPLTASYMQNRPITRVRHPTEHSSLLIFLVNLSKFSLALFISLPSVIVISLILPFVWFIRTILRLICRYRCPVTPCSCSYLSASDLFWFYDEQRKSERQTNDETTKLSSSTGSPTGAAIFFLEGAINENSLKKLLINRLISNNSRRSGRIGRKLFPRFSQIIVSRFSGTMWIDYSAFSIDEHVQEIPRDIQSDEDLQSYVSTLVSTDLTRTRPLWQLHFKNRLAARNQESVLVFIYHPVLSDGISLVRILLRYVVDNRTTQLDIKPRFVGRHNERALDYIKAYLFGHFLIFRRLFFRSSVENFFKRNSSKTHDVNHIATIDSRPQQRQRRIVVWSDPYNLSQANRMKLVTRTRMNDLLSTFVISTVKLYMERRGISHPPDMSCIVPCDLRSNPNQIVMGNELSHLSIDLPMNIEGNIPVLWSFNENMKNIKDQGDYATMYLFTFITYLLFPLCLANKIIARVYNHASLWLTTFAAGTSTALATMSVCNRDVRSFICLSPSIGTASINFCVTSYADEIRLAVIADSHIIPDPHFFTECFLHQMNVVYDLLAHRRIPGEIRRIIRPPRIQPPKKSISSISDMSDDLTIEEIQAKMTALQQELLSLKIQFENADADDPASQTQRLAITAKLEELRREFRELLIKLQERQCELSGMIPSDEEDEMDPHVRVRLRSSSVASRISLRSNDQRLLSAKAYQMEKEEGSEFTATIFRAGASSSKSSLTVQPMTEQHDGLRRVQSVGIYENPQSDQQARKSLDRTRPTTPAQSLTTNSTVLHLDPNDQWKHTTGI